ncbi:MAG TPA: YigZ family protein [Bacteroidales bacterium]|nr:YigZ family protein [Bacteroidales bacterium]
MGKDEFLTIAQPSEGFYKEKGSKFLGFAYPVQQEQEIKKKLEQLKSTYHDARHHCYAYRLGTEGDNFRMNDDGEPSSTAGRPILGQIKSHGLTNVLVVVVRYFGGTLLGTSGLIRSYKEAADQALKQARIIKKTIQALYQLEFDYALMNDVMKVLHETNIQPYEKDFQEKVTFHIGIRKSQEQQVVEQFKQIHELKVKPL